jgi:RHS repeat-associated protein
MNIASAMNGSQFEGLSYGYDALNRPIARNSDIFGYNERSEVTGATVSGSAAEYAYDEIGNSATYTANNLNQYSQFQYDLDGNILSDGVHMFTYDSVGRLKTVSSNGVLFVTNHYDAQSRRVKKVTPASTTTFFYDDWNLIEERIAYTNGTTSTIKYYWGKDLSGSLQGAGGVGGLLYLTVSNSNSQLELYIPCCDNNGNITKYVDSIGNIVASYTYDAFGKLISKSGALADLLRHRFSTKYIDVETGLYYYGYRFYHPILMRWLNRDPIEEDGGVNLYGFCGNNGVVKYDKDGCAYFIKRRLDYTPWIDYFAQNPKLDKINREVVHEQLVFEDGDTPPDVGYFSDNTNKTDSVWKSRKWIRVPGTYNDCVMRKAVAKVKPLPYSLLGDKNKGVPQYNCQDYADALRSKYYELIKDKKIRCECGIDKSK